MKNSIYIYLFFFLISSCSHKIQLLKDIELNEKSKLYFYNIPSTDRKDIQYKNDFKSKHKNFFIDDLATLNQIKKEWILEKSDERIPMETFYRISLLEGNKILWGGVLHLEGNEIITTTYPLKFDISMLEKYSDKFNQLKTFSVKCDNIINARLLFEELNKRKVFVGIFENEEKKNPLYSYDGVTSLLLPRDENTGDFKEVEKNVRDDFKKIGDIKVARFSASIHKDSIEIDLYSKTNISNVIPEKYTIIRDYTILTDIEFSIFGIGLKDLKQIITNLKLENSIYIDEIY